MSVTFLPLKTSETKYGKCDWLYGCYFCNFLRVLMSILLPEESLYLTILNRVSRLCLMGIAETPGCATLLPASLFVNSHPGTGPLPFLLRGCCDRGLWPCLPEATTNNTRSSLAQDWTRRGENHRLSEPVRARRMGTASPCGSP